MLYFTMGSEGETPKALYNGRFAFVRGVSQGQVQEYLQTDKSSIPNALSAIAHEHHHQNVFLLTKTGAVLSGYRQFVRVFFGISRQSALVGDYYRARAIFFIQMQQFHEEVVRGAKSAQEIGLSPSQESDMMRRDVWVKNAWRNHKLRIRLFPWSVLESIGKMYAKPFAVVAGADAEGVWQGTWVAEKGTVNDLASKRSNDTLRDKVSRHVLPWLHVERWFPNDVDSNWRWLLAKAKAEHSIYQAEKYHLQFPKYHDHDSLFADDLFRTVCFAASWAGANEPFDLPMDITDQILAYVHGYGDGSIR
jgi:hypothetical protein